MKNLKPASKLLFASIFAIASGVEPIEWLLCAIVSPASLLLSFWFLQSIAPLIPWLALGWSVTCFMFFVVGCFANLKKRSVRK